VRVARGQNKLCAVIAVVRKLVRALFYVARGERFDAAKLFDVRRLNLQQPAQADVEPTLAEVLQLDETSVSETMDPALASVLSAPAESVCAQGNAGAPRKDERAKAPSKCAQERKDVPRTEPAKRGDGVRLSAAPAELASQRAPLHPSGRSRGRAVDAETEKSLHGARAGRLATTGPVATLL
jgi:hypothetical protein